MKKTAKRLRLDLKVSREFFHDIELFPSQSVTSHRIEPIENFLLQGSWT